MNSIYKVFIALTGIILSTSASAGTWTNSYKVESLYLNSLQEGVFVKLQTMSNPEKCPSEDYFFLSNTNKHYEKIYSILLAANASKKTVSLYLSGCDSNNNRPLFIHIKN